MTITISLTDCWSENWESFGSQFQIRSFTNQWTFSSLWRSPLNGPRFPFLVSTWSLFLRYFLTSQKLRPCVTRFFPKFLFSFFKNKGRNEFFELFSNSSRIAKTRSDPNFRKKCVFSQKIRVRTSQNEPFTKITEKMTFNSSHLDSQKLVPTRNLTQNFRKKLGMQGPIKNYSHTCKINALTIVRMFKLIRVRFHQQSLSSFCAHRFQKRKQSWQSFSAFAICIRKSCL